MAARFRSLESRLLLTGESVSDHPKQVRAIAELEEYESGPSHFAELHRLRGELVTQNAKLRQTEALLEDLHDRYLNLFDFSPVALFTLSPDGLIYEMNYAAAELFGIERKLLLNQYFNQCVQPLDVARWEALFEQALNSDEKLGCQLHIRRKDGADFPAYLECIRIENRHGDTSLRVVLFDVTKRERADRQLQESEQKYRAIFDGTLDGIMLADETGLIVEYNPEILRISGLSDAELRRMHVWGFRPAEKMLATRNIISQIMSMGGSATSEFKYKKPNGQVIRVEARGVRLVIGDKSYLKCVVRDITERKNTENELKEYQRLLRQLSSQSIAAREAEMKRIARELHDELGQTLTALRMDISLLRIQFAEHEPLMKNMIKDMLMLVDKAINGVRNVATNLRPPILDMGIMAAVSWLGKDFSVRTGIRCSVNVAHEMEILEKLDDIHVLTLFRIVQESLTNIARHAGASEVEISFRQCGECVCVSIHDNGVGFDPSEMPAKKSFGLMGMRERALALQGKVELTSEKGHGTTVMVYMPPYQTNPGRRIDD